MSVNDWYKEQRELTAEEMTSPWVVTDPSQITEDKVRAYYAVSGKKIDDETVAKLVRAMQKAWKGHLCDYHIPRKNGAVLIGHLIPFTLKNIGAIECYNALSPTAKPNCYLSKFQSGNIALPVIVYGEHYIFYHPKQGLKAYHDFDVTQLKPISDYAFRKQFPEVRYGDGSVVKNAAEAYIKLLHKIVDLRIVVAIDKAYYDKDISIFSRIAEDSELRPAVVVVGAVNAPERKKLLDERAYREVYVCEDPSLLPVCLGKTRSLLISDNKELCENIAGSGVKVIAIDNKCPYAVAEIPRDKTQDITPEFIRQQFVRVTRSVG